MITILFTGCASMMSQTDYTVSIMSSPSGADYVVKNRRGLSVHRGVTPSTVVLNASAGYFSPERYTIELGKAGFVSSSYALNGHLDETYLLNILWYIFSPIGFLLVDPATGAMWKLDRSMHAELVPGGNGSNRIFEMPSTGANGSNYRRIDVSSHPHRNSTAAILTFDARTGVSSDEVALLADRFAVELGRFDVYKVISRSKMKEVLEEQKFSVDCSSAECAVEAGKILSAEYMIYGSIGRLGSMFTINVYITSVETGGVVSEATVDYGGPVEGLLTEGMPQAVQNLINAVAVSSPSEM